MARERRNGKKARREFVKQSVATLGAIGTLGGAPPPADAVTAAVPRPTPERSPSPRAAT